VKANPIAELERALMREFASSPKGPRAAQIIAEYARRNDDWRAFARFSPHQYTRNLVARNEHFEMIVLCWSAGQQSPIHNHANQNCWMAVLEGEISEVQFRVVSSGEPIELVQGATKLYRPGQVTFINDDIALHRVAPVAAGAGISLHLYSKPIDVCNVYDERTGRIEQRQLQYFSTPSCS
jgi:predicted metal-dependent enzyme (double-stranded beta helix superfamily)